MWWGIIPDGIFKKCIHAQTCVQTFIPFQLFIMVHVSVMEQ